MRTMSALWNKGAKDVNRSQGEVPKESISRSGRIRKIKDVSAYYYGTSTSTSTMNSNRVSTVTATTANLENSKKGETESVAMEAEEAPAEVVEDTPEPEPVKDNKSRVNADLLQKVLSESVEEWFSFAEVIKSNKGKPYKKRKIVLPPMDDSNFCFELTQTKDTVEKPKDEDSKMGSTSNEEPKVCLIEENKKEEKELEINENDKAVINKKRKMITKSASLGMVDEESKIDPTANEESEARLIEESNKEEKAVEMNEDVKVNDAVVKKRKMTTKSASLRTVDEDSKMDSTSNEEPEPCMIEESNKEGKAVEVNGEVKVNDAVINKKRKMITKSASLRMVDEDSKMDSTSNEEPEALLIEESKKEEKAVEISKDDKANNSVINKKRKVTTKSASLRAVDKERKIDPTANEESEPCMIEESNKEGKAVEVNEEVKVNDAVINKKRKMTISSASFRTVDEDSKIDPTGNEEPKVCLVDESKKEEKAVEMNENNKVNDAVINKMRKMTTKSASLRTVDEDSKIDPTANEEPKVHLVEENKKEEKELEIRKIINHKNDKANNSVINKKRKMTTKSASLQMADEDVKEDKTVEKKDSEAMPSTSKTNEISENDTETTTENGKNKHFRHFYALILYGDEVNSETKPDNTTSDSDQKNSDQQAKTVIKTLNLETADLKEFEVELGDFSKLPKDSPIFECMSGIERLLQTGTTESALQESVNGETLSAFPKSYKEREKRNAEMSAAFPSEHRKMNLKARQRLLVLSKDIMQKYKRKSKGKKNQEAQVVKEEKNEEEKADEKKKEPKEKAKKLKKTNLKEVIVDKAEPKNKPKTNENVPETSEKEEVNEPIEEKVETELEKPETTKKTNKTCTKKRKLKTDKRMKDEKDNKMSAVRCKKRKQLGQARTRVKLEKLFSYVNAMKRKSGYKSSSESAESMNGSNERPAPKGSVSNNESRVEEMDVKETKERRKSRREIKLTPKLVHMIATSHKRTRRSPSIREDSMDDSDYEYQNLLKKVVSGSATPEVGESSSSLSAIESYPESKPEVNSDLECNWQPGDIVWARFAGSPFWPSLVLRDPFSNNEYRKVKHLGRLLKTFVHLQFLADSGRRAWVPQHYCMSFNGLEEFEEKKSNLPKIDSFTQRNDLLYQKAFFPKKQIEMSWLVAVIEGESVLKKSIRDRIKYMKVKYPLVKYAPCSTNGQPSESEVACNGAVSDETTSGEVASHSYGTRLRKARSSSAREPLDSANCEKASTSQEPSTSSTNTDDTFECVSPAGAEDNRSGNERDAPKITLKIVRSPKRSEKREWNKLSDNTEGPLVKKPKKNVPVSLNTKSKSGVALKNKKKGGEKKEEVCEVCLRMLGRRNVIKCNGVCTGVIPRGSRKRMGVKVERLEEGAAPALKKRKRRRKFSSPRVNKWKEKLRSIFDFYKEYGGCKQEGMDVRGLFSLYRSLCNNTAEKRRRSVK